MRTGLVLLNFGEPERADHDEVVAYLERIFSLNATLEPQASGEEVRRRSRELAQRRAPGLLEEYREIGGSPLNRQSAEQAEALEAELQRRGHEARAYVGMQFTEPSIGGAVERARAEGMEQLVGLPVYPLCGPSTTIAALEALEAEVRRLDWSVALHQLAGWHAHPAYVALWADQVRATASEAGFALEDPAVRLVFSAHGTPMKYVHEGSRYTGYVNDFCGRLADALGGADYVVGYQNHGNRRIEWTQPDIESVIASLDGDADAVVLVPVSFMHEQSETLAELDIELREEVKELGMTFHRVPVPYADPRFIAMLADLVEATTGDAALDGVSWGRCACRPGAYCTNARI